MPQANLNALIAQLQTEIHALQNEAGATARKEVATTIEKTHDSLIDIIQTAKPSRALQTFLETISQTTAELYQVALSLEDEPNMERPRALLQHLSEKYQETIVPMLTRLNNLAEDSESMQKITNLAYLGNEIMSCANQVYQFNEKMNPDEKIYGMLGTVLMMAGVGLTIQILSVTDTPFAMPTALTMITLGSVLCRLAITQHDNDPEADLARKAVSNTEKTIQSAKEILLGSSSEVEETLVVKSINAGITKKTTTTLEAAPKAKKTAKPIKQETTKKEDAPPEKPTGFTAKFLSAIGFMKHKE